MSGGLIAPYQAWHEKCELGGFSMKNTKASVTITFSTQVLLFAFEEIILIFFYYSKARKRKL